MQQKSLHNLSDEQALDFQQRDPELWAVVIAPWVLVQERKKNLRQTKCIDKQMPQHNNAR